MKLNMKLGVPTEALLRHPTACFRLSKAATRVSNALAFTEFYVNNRESGYKLLPRDLEHMAVSMSTTSKSADDLAVLVDDPTLRKQILAYSKDAMKIKNLLQRNLPKAKEKAKAQNKPEAKAVNVQSLIKKTIDLREKFKLIEGQVESLCTVDGPKVESKPVYSPPGSSTMQGRVRMAGTNIIHRKRPMYPRYFVASMGRSRR